MVEGARASRAAIARIDSPDTSLGQDLPDRGMRTIREASDLVKRLSFLPALPFLVFFASRLR